jgi:serine/threonine protein kinase
MMEINGGKNMVMEYCSSRTLADLIHKYYALWPQGGMLPSSMPLQLVAHVKKQLADALLHIYGKGIVH